MDQTDHAEARKTLVDHRRADTAAKSRRVRREPLLAWAVALLCASLPATAAGQDGPGFQVVGPAFLAIQTTDVEAASDWYRSVLRLEEVNRIEAPDGSYAIRILTDSRLTVELIRSSTATPPSGVHHGLFKSGFFVDDIESAHHWLHDNAVDADAAIFDDHALGVRSFVFRDLDGNRIQVFQPLPAGGQSGVSAALGG